MFWALHEYNVRYYCFAAATCTGDLAKIIRQFQCGLSGAQREHFGQVGVGADGRSGGVFVPPRKQQE